MLYYERNLITTSGFTLDRERQKIHYGKNDHTASILIDRNRCQNGHISLLIVAGEPTWSQLYPPHAGWIRRLDTSRSGFFTLLSRQRQLTMATVLKEIPLSLGTLRATSQEVVMSYGYSGRCGSLSAVHCARSESFSAFDFQ